MKVQSMICLVLVCIAAGLFLQHFVNADNESYIAPTPAYINNDVYVGGPKEPFADKKDTFTVVHSNVYGTPPQSYDADLEEAASEGTINTIDNISGFHGNLGKMNI